MSNFECTVTIADIYGEEWWSRNKAELEREWEWGFGMDIRTNLIADKACFTLQAAKGHLPVGPRIILHRRKPKPPTLREVYGMDEVTIPVGWEWTGEFKQPKKGDNSMDANPPYYPVSTWDTTEPYPDHPPRLILRERPKKVWYKCEAEPRVPRNGDWFYSYGAWGQSDKGGDGIYLCATRHEEVDQTVQVVTQAMVDRVGQV